LATVTSIRTVPAEVVGGALVTVTAVSVVEVTVVAGGLVEEVVVAGADVDTAAGAVGSAGVTVCAAVVAGRSVGAGSEPSPHPARARTAVTARRIARERTIASRAYRRRGVGNPPRIRTGNHPSAFPGRMTILHIHAPMRILASGDD
jgi:hypothetical protein